MRGVVLAVAALLLAAPAGAQSLGADSVSDGTGKAFDPFASGADAPAAAPQAAPVAPAQAAVPRPAPLESKAGELVPGPAIQAGIRTHDSSADSPSLPDQMTVPAAPPAAPASPAAATPAPAATAAPAAVPAAVPVSIEHPKVIDTATLEGEGHTLHLFGIAGMAGEAASGLQGFIAGAGDRVTCQAQADGAYVCLLADGTDVALAALANGAAQAGADAPDVYRDQEAQAQAARRGVWSTLPPPPVTVSRPVVRDTATLASDKQLYLLDGVEGLGGQYARDLQGYIAANGNELHCQPQGAAGHYVCLLPDGTDIAKVALVNGAARVASDAPDSYRVQQREALANRRGIWINPPPDAVASLRPPPPPPPPQSGPPMVAYVTAPEQPPPGMVYVGGAPTIAIDGAPMFLVYGGPVGWGYYDHWHHWHRAPESYARHMEHYHPGGAGLRGYAAAGQPHYYGREVPGQPHASAVHSPFVAPNPALRGNPTFGGGPMAHGTPMVSTGAMVHGAPVVHAPAPRPCSGRSC